MSSWLRLTLCCDHRNYQSLPPPYFITFLSFQTKIRFLDFEKKKKLNSVLKLRVSHVCLSATFHIFSKCHFLSNGEGVCSQQAISGHPSQPTLNYRKNMKKKKSKKKNSKKKVKKNLRRTPKKKYQKNSKCHISNFF